VDESCANCTAQDLREPEARRVPDSSSDRLMKRGIALAIAPVFQQTRGRKEARVEEQSCDELTEPNWIVHDGHPSHSSSSLLANVSSSFRPMPQPTIRRRDTR